MKTFYFKITGMNNGMEIDPFYIESFEPRPSDSVLNVSGDNVRYYKKISKEEYNNAMEISEELRQQGLKDYEELKDLIKDKSYSQVLDLCFNLQDFEVFNLDNKIFDFNYKLISGTITKEKGLIDVFDIWYNDNIYSFRYEDLKEELKAYK